MNAARCLIALSLLLAGCAAAPAEAKPEKEKQAVSSVNKPSGTIIQEADTEMIPAFIRIPSIGVETAVEKVGTLENGQMDVPKDVENAGWYEPGTKPGGQGSSVIAGHVDSKTGPAIFYKLNKVKKGDLIEIEDQDGNTLTFSVYDTKSFPRLEAPVNEIFGFTYRKTLNLITCTGEFNHDKGTHEERLVVYTELVEQ